MHDEDTKGAARLRRASGRGGSLDGEGRNGFGRAVEKAFPGHGVLAVRCGVVVVRAKGKAYPLRDDKQWMASKKRLGVESFYDLLRNGAGIDRVDQTGEDGGQIGQREAAA